MGWFLLWFAQHVKQVFRSEGHPNFISQLKATNPRDEVTLFRGAGRGRFCMVHQKKKAQSASVHAWRLCIILSLLRAGGDANQLLNAWCPRSERLRLHPKPRELPDHGLQLLRPGGSESELDPSLRLADRVDGPHARSKGGWFKRLRGAEVFKRPQLGRWPLAEDATSGTQ